MAREMIFENCDWMSPKERQRFVTDVAKGLPIKTGGRIVGTTIKAVFHESMLHIIYEPSQNEQESEEK